MPFKYNLLCDRGCWFARNTVQCHYNMVNFLQNLHKRHPMSCLNGQAMGFKFWFIYSVTRVKCAISCNIGSVITAPDCIGKQEVNTLRPRQNGRCFADYVFKCIFLIENVWILLKISLKFVPNSPNNNIPPLVHVMAWHRSGDKPLSEPVFWRIYVSFGLNESNISLTVITHCSLADHFIITGNTKNCCLDSFWIRICWSNSFWCFWTEALQTTNFSASESEDVQVTTFSASVSKAVQTMISVL